MPTLEDVREFWERNPLWSGESKYPAGTREFFEEHRAVYIDDCLAGSFDERVVPALPNRRKVLDLGCGPGFWTVELALRGCSDITAADITEQALALTERRCENYGIAVHLSRENAEVLSFPDGTFSHVNCQGVIHHTPNTEACVREIARVLEDSGTACISVYYRNAVLRNWRLLRWVGSLLSRFGAKLQGRGREHIYTVGDVDEIVRLYDGSENPIGKAYSREAFEAMLTPYFHVEEIFLHGFPARTLPFRLPRSVHRLLDRTAGFMIYANVKKL